jgi:hypothetical protein
LTGPRLTGQAGKLDSGGHGDTGRFYEADDILWADVLVIAGINDIALFF